MFTTSASLLERLRQPQDHEAWGRFVRLYTPLLLRWACRAGLQEEDAWDLTQEVFAALILKFQEFTYDRGKSFRAWLRTVAMNKLRDKRRKRSQPQPLGEGAEPVDEHDPFWEEEYRQHLVARAMKVMQADFQPRTWKACWENVVAGRPALEVARELGMSVGAVYVAKLRVLDRLREELQGMLD